MIAADTFLVARRSSWMVQSGQETRVMTTGKLCIVVAGLTVLLAACGEDPGTRALTGGLLGAGAGAAVAGATGGNAGVGALVGGGIGAVGGAATTPRRY
jgi:osmotically inducible lipoprotein OsmB